MNAAIALGDLAIPPFGTRLSINSQNMRNQYRWIVKSLGEWEVIFPGSPTVWLTVLLQSGRRSKVPLGHYRVTELPPAGPRFDQWERL